ncbi:MAG: hypothetical protein FVQ82_04235 [Planctomycetes bacterium]|nr:hypothetical protein [Planctomycetota bacterium]
MFSKISHTWSLMGASWQVLKKDKEILVFPLISGICCLIVIASFALPMIATDAWQLPEKGATLQQQIAYYAILFAFYLCNYFVIVFFNSAIIACATIRLRGGDPTVGDGLRMAMARLPLIFGWALVSATVGLILRIIEDKSEKLGRFVAGLLGMAWSVVSFLVIPVLVIEKKSPIGALKESTALLKKTWGEQIIGNFNFGFIFFLLNIPAILIIVLGIMSQNAAIMITCIVVGVIYLLVVALIQSALQSIFQAAIYLYAKDGQVPEGFDTELLDEAMVLRVK